MNKTKQLDAAISMLRAPQVKRSVRNMRAQYETALSKLGWVKETSNAYASEWRKDNKRMLVENGDRVFIKMNYLEVKWKTLPFTGRQNLLLRTQTV